ncbi:CocE/NonD family hydrolase [Actinokineospora sp. G85]|uniref:CocE/NonD family hydrolase n=1 Tax=Actinokineospora sp. G85 TaxID=3406626 RepID=UPI003C728F1E
MSAFLVRLLAVALLAGLCLVGSGPAATADWAPGPAAFGMGSRQEVPVTMDDGTVLRADVHYPTNPDGTPAEGPFPVVLTQTPYGALMSVAPGLSDPDAGLALLGGGNRYLVERGYINVIADVRGTGGSQGVWDFLGKREALDGAALVRWAADLPNSSGVVGLEGASYMAINQFFTVAELGADSPVKAMFPVVPSLDPYRDMTFPGGNFGVASNVLYLAMTGFMQLVNAATAGNPDLATVLLQRAAGLLSFHADLLLQAVGNGELVNDGPYWRSRSPRSVLPRVVATGVPIQMVGGWDDVFERGQMLLYNDLQTLAAGGEQGRPMSPDQPVDPDYRMVMGPWHHVTAGAGIDMDRLRVQWFDHHLKGVDTGLAGPPLRLNEVGADRWVGATHFPFPEATPTVLHPGADGSLSTTAPTRSGTDTIIYAPVAVPCNRGLDQATAGGLVAVFNALKLPLPCTYNDNLTQLPLLGKTYTTEPFASPQTIAGPLSASILATASRSDTQFAVTVSTVAPNGLSRPVASGSLLGSHRAVDESRSWRAPDGSYLLPFHPYTLEAKQPVRVGAKTRYDIEVPTTFARVEAGHRLRVTVSSADTPRLLSTPLDLLNQLGGIYGVEWGPGASHFQIPMAPADAFAEAPAVG